MKYELPIDPVNFALMHDTGYFGIPMEKLEDIKSELAARGIENPTEDEIMEICWEFGIDPGNLTEEDEDALFQFPDE